MKTGIFCGSFNPIHIGHLALANYLCEYEELDEIWFMISPQNPLKRQADLLKNELRLELAKAAISEYPRFRVSDFEFSLPCPSYTANTLDKLKETYPERLFHLIIGSDNWGIFDQWKDYEHIIAEYPILIYPRPYYPVDETKPLPTGVRAVNAPLLDISSTFIRESLAAGKDMRFFLHPEVYRTLRDFSYYTSENRK